jgi:hypothetical protein
VNSKKAWKSGVESNMKATEFDKVFDDGEEDIIPLLDLATVNRPGVKTPNATTCNAIAELEAGKAKRSANVDELMAELNVDNDRMDAIDYNVATDVLERVRTGKEKVYSSVEVRKELGLDD